ncbi:Os06g0296967, partial [Oryza sativa Japonica Group]
MNHDVDEDGCRKHRGEDGGEPAPAAPGDVGHHEAEQIDHHDPSHRHEPGPLHAEREEEDGEHERRHERRRVEVVEQVVPEAAGVRQDGVAGEVFVRGLQPDAPRRVEPRDVGHRRHQDGEQQEVLAQLPLP